LSRDKDTKTSILTLSSTPIFGAEQSTGSPVSRSVGNSVSNTRAVCETGRYTCGAVGTVESGFSNQYLNPALRGRNKFGSIRYMVDLPFEPVAIRQNLDLVCPYCFFGGPDKTPGRTIDMTIDLASRVSKTSP